MERESIPDGFDGSLCGSERETRIETPTYPFNFQKIGLPCLGWPDMVPFVLIEEQDCQKHRSHETGLRIRPEIWRR